MTAITNKRAIPNRAKNLFALLYFRLNFDLSNTSDQILELDLLRDNAKKELLYIVTYTIEQKFLELSSTNFQSQNSELILIDILTRATKAFLLKYYGFALDINSSLILSSFYTRAILEDSLLLIDIPFNTIRNENPKIFYTTFSPIYSSVSFNFIEALLDNLVIKISTAVLQIVNNELSSIYDIRQTLYRAEFLSVRNIERFKNNLAWTTRFNNYVLGPRNLYNSQCEIFVVRTAGVQTKTIYANNLLSLNNLEKLPLATINSLELKDFIVSRVDEIFYFLGNSVRYTLTAVVGRVIGLIWRGIIDGLKKKP